MNTLVISAFPCTGKTHFHNTRYELSTLDSDSSTFDKADFPQNYIDHIKENIGKVDVIFVSSHKEVRDALVKNGLNFILVYPRKSIQSEYYSRMRSRGNSLEFVKFITNHWSEFIDQMENQEGCIRVRLERKEYIGDVLGQ